jgi:hypothetical protein
VIVGSLPTNQGAFIPGATGCLIVLGPAGKVVETISGGPINGPWDMTVLDQGVFATLFVTNVLNGTVAAGGRIVEQQTVLRITLRTPDDRDPILVPRVFDETIIGSNFGAKTDINALVIGPTGLGLDSNGVLYVADTLLNRIAAIPAAVTRPGTAFTGTTVSQGGALNGPLGLAIAPNGNIIVTNGGDGNMVETTPAGFQFPPKNVDVTNTGAGTLFGLAVIPSGVYFVNDGNNKLYLLH